MAYFRSGASKMCAADGPLRVLETGNAGAESSVCTKESCRRRIRLDGETWRFASSRVTLPSSDAVGQDAVL